MLFKSTLGVLVALAVCVDALPLDGRTLKPHLPTNISVWDEPFAEFMVEFARAAYCDHSVLVDWTCQLCFEGFELRWVTPLNNTKDVQAFVGYHSLGNLIIVSFRGTQDLKNWVEDLEFSKIDFDYQPCANASSPPIENWTPECKIHKGFWDSYESVSDNITTAVTSLRQQHPNALIAVTGHSFGGALAALSAVDLNLKLGNAVMYSFGEPRVGNWYFAQFLDHKMNGAAFRVVHNRDLVPHLPGAGTTPLLSLNFFHERTEVWQRGASMLYTYQVCDGSGEDPECSDSLWPWMLQVSDHAQYMGRTMHDCAPPPVPPISEP